MNGRDSEWVKINLLITKIIIIIIKWLSRIYISKEKVWTTYLPETLLLKDAVGSVDEGHCVYVLMYKEMEEVKKNKTFFLKKKIRGGGWCGKQNETSPFCVLFNFFKRIKSFDKRSSFYIFLTFYLDIDSCTIVFFMWKTCPQLS